jgi:hypothetical protein
MAQHAFKKTVEVAIAAVVLGADLTTVAGKAPFNGTIDSVEFIPNATLTGANTNTRKHDVINKGAAGSGSANAASLQYNSGVNATAFVPKTITKDATAANYAVTAGDVIVIVSTHIGTGIADPGGLFRIVFARSVPA